MQTTASKLIDCFASTSKRVSCMSSSDLRLTENYGASLMRKPKYCKRSRFSGTMSRFANNLRCEADCLCSISSTFTASSATLQTESLYCSALRQLSVIGTEGQIWHSFSTQCGALSMTAWPCMIQASQQCLMEPKPHMRHLIVPSFSTRWTPWHSSIRT